MSTNNPDGSPSPTPPSVGMPYAAPPGYAGDQYPQDYALPPGMQLQPGMPGPLYLEPPTSALAISSLILGIGGFIFLPFLSSIAAVICGHLARNEIRNSQGQIRGGALALAGLVLGYVGIALVILALIGFFVFLFLVSPTIHFHIQSQ